MKNIDPIKSSLMITLNQASAYTFKKITYTRDQLNAFEEVNLIALLYWLFGKQLKQVDVWLTITGHPNLLVFPEALYDRVAHKVYSPIEAIKLLFGYNFPQACFVISSFFDLAILEANDRCAKAYPEQMSSRLLDCFNLNEVLEDNLLNNKAQGNQRARQVAFGVLNQELGISRSVIAALIAEKRLIIDKRYVFGFLEYIDGKVVTNTKYKHNNDGKFVFSVDTVKREATFTQMYKPRDGQKIQDVYVFESIIELLSFLSLVEENLITEPVENSCLISLNSTFPHPLIAFLNEHPSVGTIHTCFSNQSAGFAATDSIIKNKSLSKYKIIKADDLQMYTGMHGKYVKTWNELLRVYNNIRKQEAVARKRMAEDRKNAAAILKKEEELNNHNYKGDSDHE